MNRFNANGRSIVWYYQSMLEVLLEKEAPAVLTVPLTETVSDIARAVVPSGRTATPASPPGGCATSGFAR